MIHSECVFSCRLNRGWLGCRHTHTHTHLHVLSKLSVVLVTQTANFKHMQLILTPLLVSFKGNNVSNELQCHIAAQCVTAALWCSYVAGGTGLQETVGRMSEVHLECNWSGQVRYIVCSCCSVPSGSWYRICTGSNHLMHPIADGAYRLLERYKLSILSTRCLYVLRTAVTARRVKRLVFVIETDVSSVRRELNVYTRTIFAELSHKAANLTRPIQAAGQCQTASAKHNSSCSTEDPHISGITFYDLYQLQCTLRLSLPGYSSHSLSATVLCYIIRRVRKITKRGY